jgi:hypothetical protein
MSTLSESELLLALRDGDTRSVNTRPAEGPSPTEIHVPIFLSNSIVNLEHREAQR